MTAGLSLSYHHDRQNNKIPKMSQGPLIKTVLRFIEECVCCSKKQHNATQLGLYYTYAKTKYSKETKNKNKTPAWTYITHIQDQVKTQHTPFEFVLHKCMITTKQTKKQLFGL